MEVYQHSGVMTAIGIVLTFHSEYLLISSDYWYDRSNSFYACKYAELSGKMTSVCLICVVLLTDFMIFSVDAGQVRPPSGLGELSGWNSSKDSVTDSESLPRLGHGSLTESAILVDLHHDVIST